MAALLTHYWSPTEPAAARQAQLQDWIEDLNEFPVRLVDEACREWRRGPEHARRPLPGDIRQLCIRQQVERDERRMISNARQPWPDWLRDLWGPPPEGPRLRAQAIEERHRRTEEAVELQRRRTEASGG